MEPKFTIEHIALVAKNTTALKDWYVEKLGARVFFQMPQEPPAFLIDLAGLLIEIYPARIESDLTQDNSLAGWRHLALRVENLEQTRDWLAARGVVFPDPVRPAGGGGRVLFFRDLEGNLLHLVERNPEGLK